jgi:hypothetical protein
LGLAVSVLEGRGYRCGDRHYHDVSLYSPNGTHLELHFNIQENMDSLDAVLKDAWKHATPMGGSRYAFGDDFFVFHMYAHMAYHFLSGGCGIRSLMDIWVMEHHMHVDYRCAQAHLKKAGIYKFAREMSRIAGRCFADRDFSDPILSYIWHGGIYGSRRNRLTVERKKRGGGVLYIFKKIFLPYRTMSMSYPILRKLPFLLPFLWIYRCVRAIIKGKSNRIAIDMLRLNQISKEDVDEITEICMRLGL